MKLNFIPLLLVGILFSTHSVAQEKAEFKFPILKSNNNSLEILLESTSLIFVNRLSQRKRIKPVSPLPKKKFKSLDVKSKYHIELSQVNGLLQGTYKVWYENGQLEESLTFNDNYENGPALFYHENGQLAAKGMYYMGEMVGIWEFYDERGYLYTGEWKWNFAELKGNTRMEGKVILGKPVGVWSYRNLANQQKVLEVDFEEEVF